MIQAVHRGNQPVVVTTTVAAVHQNALHGEDSSCKLWKWLFVFCFITSFVLISATGSKGSVVLLLIIFIVTVGCCAVCIRRQRMAEETEIEASLASARLGNLDLGVLRGHNARERGQNDPSPQQPPVIVVDKETRRTLLHYFKFQPSDEESAERGDIECGAPDSKTGLESDAADSEGAPAGSCIICFGDFAIGEELCRLPCFHLYHATCIDEWFDGANHEWCPLCKTDVLAAAVAIRPAPGSSTSTTTPINVTTNQGASRVAA